MYLVWRQSAFLMSVWILLIMFFFPPQCTHWTGVKSVHASHEHTWWSQSILGCICQTAINRKCKSADRRSWLFYFKVLSLCQSPQPHRVNAAACSSRPWHRLSRRNKLWQGFWRVNEAARHMTNACLTEDRVDVKYSSVHAHTPDHWEKACIYILLYPRWRPPTYRWQTLLFSVLQKCRITIWILVRCTQRR